MFDETKYDHFLDTKGLNCPLPILKTKKALVSMQVGETIHVVATDPGSVADFEAFAAQARHRLSESWTDQQEFHFVLVKSPK